MPLPSTSPPSRSPIGYLPGFYSSPTTRSCLLRRSLPREETFADLLRDESQQENTITMFAELRRIRDEVLAWLEDYYHYLESTEGGTEFKEEFAKWYL